MKKTIITKIGNSHLAYVFMCGIVDTIAHLGVLIGTGAISLASIICFYLLPLCRYQPFHWDVPSWMISNEPMKVVAVVSTIIFIVHCIVIMFVNYCWNKAIYAEEESEAC